MNLLSNFFSAADAPVAPKAVCRAARPTDHAAALRQVLGCDDESQIHEFITSADERRIDLTALWVAEADGRLLWSLLPIVSPGRTALLLSPHRADDRQKQAAGALIHQVCAHCADQKVELAQTLVDPHERAIRTLFESCGFSLMAELEYLQTHVRHPSAPEAAAEMRWITYSPAEHPRFAQAVLDTYEGSLDCPALNGVRNIDDILAGHRATGIFDPRLWFLLEERGEVQAILLLNLTPRSDSVELVYLGVRPKARGRGVGDLLMRQAIWMTHQIGRSGLCLAVDSQNPPALNLYYRHGLRRICRKIALMKDLRHGRWGAGL